MKHVQRMEVRSITYLNLPARLEDYSIAPVLVEKHPMRHLRKPSNHNEMYQPQQPVRGLGGL